MMMLTSENQTSNDRFSYGFSSRFSAGAPKPIDISTVDLQKRPRIVLESIANLLGAQENGLLIFHRSVRTIRGHKSCCLHFLFAFSETYADVLRATGWARFDGKLKCWYLPEEFVTDDLLDATFSGQFTHILDLDADLLIETGMAMPAPLPPYFEILPTPVTFSAADVTTAYARARPQDELGATGKTAIFQGDRFVELPVGRLATNYPLVLVRFPVEGGHPRYVTFSPISGELERVSFYKESGRAIARMRDAIRHHKVPVLVPAEEDREASLDRVSVQIRRVLSPFFDAADLLLEVFPDASISILHGAYLELLDGEGNRDSHRVHAKVRSRSTRHLSAMARALDQSGSREIVVHPRSFDGQDPELPLITLIHELAHHLDIELTGGFGENSHDLKWSVICAALLRPFLASGDISARQLINEFSPYLSDMGLEWGGEMEIIGIGAALFRDAKNIKEQTSCADLIYILQSTSFRKAFAIP